MIDTEPLRKQLILPPDTKTVHVSEEPLKKPFTFFTMPFDKDTKTSYWNQLLQQKVYLTGMLLNDKTFRWSLDAPKHDTLQNEPASPNVPRPADDADLVRVQLTRGDADGTLPYNLYLRYSDPDALSDMITYLEKNFKDHVVGMQLRIGEMQKGKSWTDTLKFIGLFSDYLGGKR